MIRRAASLGVAVLALLAAAPVRADDGAPPDDRADRIDLVDPVDPVDPVDLVDLVDGDPVDLVDLVDTAAERLLTADDVAAGKWFNGGPITDPARVAQVLTAVTAQAELASVPTGFVSEVFADQIDATEAIQYSRFSWWKFDPDAAPATAPDLSESRALIDELNRRMVTEIAQDWAVLQGPDCDGALGAAKSEVAQRRGLDPLYRQALDVATRSYCVG